MVLIPIFPIYIRYVFYFCFLFVVFGWLGKFLCDWESVLVSKAFFGGFDHVLGVFRVSVAPLCLL